MRYKIATEGGFLIQFDEEQRATLLNEVIDSSSGKDGFSDALSSADWPLKHWEVCGLLFEPECITHWALARKTRVVATGKVRVEFTNVSVTRIPLADVTQRVGSQIWRNIVRVRSGSGGRVPSGTWRDMKLAIGAIDPSSLEALEELERQRDQSNELIWIDRPGVMVVAQQRDATGLALDAFDRSRDLRKRILRRWAPSAEGNRLTSFLDGLTDVRVIEDQVITRDISAFDGATETRHTVLGKVFQLADRKLEVFNVNRHKIEESLGVDLLYFNETFNAWTMVQYKLMEQSPQGPSYRPDAAFDRELRRMQQFRTSNPDVGHVDHGGVNYRLCGDGFYFKLCTRVQLAVLSGSLLPGMYLPRQFIEAMFADGLLLGPKGGRVVTFENTTRHITNTLFADLVRDGWIGTRGVSSSRIAEIVREALSVNQSVVIARSRPRQAAADPNGTLDALGLNI